MQDATEAARPGPADDRATRPGAGPAQPRAEGRVEIGVRHTDGQSRLAHLYQRGSAKCLLPRGEAAVTGILLNTAGGITGGDRFDWQAEVAEGATLTLATQTAERAYRVQPGEVGQSRVALVAGAGATLEWLAQETILFDRSALERRLTAEIAADARLLIVEPVILGRKAMGETVEEAHFADRWEIRREGRLARVEATRLSGPVAAIAARPAVLAGNRAFATILYAGPDAEQKLGVARRLLPKEQAGASLVHGTLAIRLAAPDGARLRSTLKTFLTGFRDRPLPRVWTI